MVRHWYKGEGMKYIRHKKLGFVLFEPHLTHEEMAERIGNRKDILSAGRVNFDEAVFQMRQNRLQNKGAFGKARFREKTIRR